MKTCICQQGAPDFIPIDQNEGVNIFELDLNPQELPQGINTARLRYRDQSMHWSSWSNPKTFMVNNGWIDSPIMHYAFTNNIEDESSEGKDFSVEDNQGIQFVNDPDHELVAYFDGSNSISIQEAFQASDGLPERSITVSAWVKFDELTDKDGFLGLIQDNINEKKGWNLGLQNERFTFSLSGETSAGITHLTHQENLETNIWYHVAATYEGSEMQLFVNGLLVGSSENQTGNIAYPGEGTLIMGAYKDEDELIHHHGFLDKVTLWQRALSVADIFRLANEPERYPIAHFPFNENINDESNNGKDFSGGDNMGMNFIMDSVRGPVGGFEGDGWINIQSGNNSNDGLPKQDITVSTWVKVNDPLTWGGFIGCVQDNGSSEFGWLLGTRNQQFSIALNSVTSGSLTYLLDPDVFTLDQWYYLTATYDGKEMHLYVDGDKKATSTSQGGPIRYPETAWFQIGSYKDNDEDFRHNGCLDEVLMWNRAIKCRRN